ncbi:vWA domain-containing protein [Ornithinimicrobium cryptoxanthini]|uniref:vWA domain-containing protein n=1 Tax=Ornithinimicrobium cryptoxanthini TaxID=2934161 RepID=UPI00211822A6|nr:VWA domain-containing protein [Ornithinimicrobium cryptoxanthini]
MTSKYEIVPFNEDNLQPRVACALLLDTSSSMAKREKGATAPIDELNDGYEKFRGYLIEDDLASRRAEVAVVQFDSSARVAVPMQEGRTLPQHTFSASGSTSMGAAINKALDLIEARKAEYKEHGVEYYRPWIVVLSDGGPTDLDVFEPAVERLTEVQNRKGVTVFPIGIGSSANMDALGRLSTQRNALPLAAVNFSAFFEWLSRTMSAVADSQAMGSSDDSDAMSEQIQLPDVTGWVTT